jgi:circadian clock protein KaiC
VIDELEHDDSALLQTGVEGLDYVLRGGLAPNRLYLLEGNPGSGKTTFALQFLLEGVRRGESCLFVTLSESEQELRTSVESHGWTLEGINVLEIAAPEESLTSSARYTMYHPSEVELAETTRLVLAEAERIKPARMVFDSLSEFRLLTETPLRYRRQILALKQYFSRQRSTVLFIDDRSGERRDMHLHSLAHGVLSLECETPEYGALRRRLHIAKLRGRMFREGYHDFLIRRGGIELFPRLIAAEHRTLEARQLVQSGLPQLDELLGGGLSQGTSTLILGAAGTGKSTLASQYLKAAAARGEHGALYLFDESLTSYLERSAGLGMPLEPLIEAGLLSIRQVDPAELSPGGFAHVLSRTVRQNNTGLVVIDSLSGFLSAMPSERYLLLHLHELLTYLGQQGVTTLLTMVQHGIVGSTMSAAVDVSYLADTVLLLRYFEAFGELRQALSVVKKRTGRHERGIRELRFDENGITVGEPLRDFEGILTGTPQFVGQSFNGIGDRHAPPTSR